jgi:hypothetical protein
MRWGQVPVVSAPRVRHCRDEYTERVELSLISARNADGHWRGTNLIYILKNNKKTILLFLDKHNFFIIIFSYPKNYLLVGSADVLFSVFIIRLLRANAHAFSAKTYALHLQLMSLLMAQLFAPIVLVAFPVADTIYTILVGARFSETSGHVGILFITAYAIINPLLTLTFITP